MRALLKTYSDLKRQLAKAEEAAYPTDSIGDGMPRGNKTSEKVAVLGVSLADLRGSIADCEADLNTFRRRIQPLIDSLPPGMPKTVLTLRYCRYMTISQLAKSAGYVREAAYKALSEAEKMISQN